jgi:hypothetical protein
MNNYNLFFDATDLGLNLDRALSSVRHLRGGPARTLGAMFLAIALALTPFVWYFDIQPTLDWIGTASDPALKALPGSLALFAPLIAVLLNLLPTLFEFALPRLASSGVKVAALLAYGASIFDATTDWPRVAQTMDAGWDKFATFGQFAGLIWYTSRIGLLFLATIGFELALIICGACALVLLINGFRKPVVQRSET